MADDYTFARAEAMMGVKTFRSEHVVKLPPMPWFGYPSPRASVDYGTVLQSALLGGILGAAVAQ